MVDDVGVVEVQAGDGPGGFGFGGFLLDGGRASGFVEVDDAVAFGVGDLLGEHAGPGGGRRRISQQRRQTAAVEEVVAQYQGARVAVDEVLADQERLGDAVG